MRLFSLFFCLSIVLYANQSNQEKKQIMKKVAEKKLSQKEKEYQSDKKRLEKENQKLEDDGFCSCNNN